MYDPIHDKIEVSASFKAGKIDVTSFTWHSKDYLVKDITLCVKARRGREVVWLLQVVTDTGAFKLRFDTDTLQWWLEEYTWEEGSNE